MAYLYVVVLVFVLVGPLRAAGGSPQPVPTPAAGRFEPNVGQFRFTDGRPASHVDAVAGVDGGTAFIHAGGVHIVRDRRQTPTPADRADAIVQDLLRTDVVFVGANRSPRLRYDDAAGDVRHVDARGSREASYARRMTYVDVWPGIDLRFSITQLGLKYDFIVHPGADPSRIAMRYDGVDDLSVDDRGSLRATTAFGPLHDLAPVSWTEGADGRRLQTVRVAFRTDGHAVRFAAADYDRERTLVIDPQHVWATYYATATGTIVSMVTTMDPFGKVIVAGTTARPDLPPSAGRIIRRHKARTDGWVARFTDRGRLLWHTYYGGSNSDAISAIATDDDGNILCCGWSESTDLPGMTAGTSPTSPYGERGAPGYAGGREMLFVRFDTAGRNTDQWLLCGNRDDEATAIAVRGNRVAIGGTTRSGVLGSDKDGYGPVATPYTQAAGTVLAHSDAVVVELLRTPAGFYDHVFLTYYGSGSDDAATGVAYDTKGNIILVGTTLGPTAPPVSDGSTFRGGTDAFVLSLKPSKNPTVNMATVFGTVEYDDVTGVATDSLDNIILVGETAAANFPLTNAMQANPAGATDSYVRKLTPTGTTIFSTYYGGTRRDILRGVGTDRSRRIWIAGLADQSEDLPVTNDAFLDAPFIRQGNDGYLAQLAENGRSVLYGSYYGADAQAVIPPFPNPPTPENPTPTNVDLGFDEIKSLYIDLDAYVVTTSLATSLRMPTTPGAWQDSNSLDKDTIRTAGFLTFWSNCRDSVVVVTVDGGGQPVICDGQGSVTLVAPTGFASYRWNDGPLATNRLTVSAPGTFICTMRTLQGCRYYDTVVVTTSPRPTVDAGADVLSCADSTAILRATPSGGTPPYTYRWNRVETGPEFIDDATSRTPGVTPTSSSRYEVLLTDAGGCTARDTVAVTLRIAQPTVAPDVLTLAALGACQASADTTVVVTNPMPWPITITEVSASASDLALVDPLGDGIVIAPGGSATLTLRLSPSTAGTINRTLTITGLPCRWVRTVTVQATKENLLASVLPSTVVFPTANACETGERLDSVVVTNNGTAAMTVALPTASAPFRVVAPVGPTVLEAGQRLTVVVACDLASVPLSTTTTNLRLPYASQDCDDTLGVVLSARRRAVRIQAGPTDIDMGTLVGCVQSADSVMVLTNSGDAELTIDLGADDALRLDPDGDPTSTTVVLAPGASRRVVVSVQPQAAGPFSFSRTLRVQPCDSTIDVTVRGVRQGLAFSIDETVDFGEIPSCSTQVVTRTLTLAVDGAETATVAAVTQPTAPALTSSLVTNATFTPSQPLNVVVSWTPTVEGSLVDSLVILLQPCDVRKVVRITGLRSTAAIAAVVPTVTLGTVPTTATGTSTFRNTGSDTVDVAVTASGGITLGTIDVNDLRGILPGGQVEIPWTLDCQGRTEALDSIIVTVDQPCPARAVVVVSGTCSADITATADVAIDTVDMRIGERRRIPLRLTASSGLDARNAHRWQATVEYNPLVVVAGGSTPDCWTPGSNLPCSIVIDGDRGTATSGILTELDLTAVLGNAPTTALRLVDFVWTDATTTITRRTDGLVRISDLCDEGGLRLLAPSQAQTLTVAPAPARDYVDVTLGGVGRQGADIVVVDLLGNIVASDHIDHQRPTVRLDLGRVASGTYTVRATTERGFHSTTVVVTR